MYFSHFGLRARPFRTTPDVDAYYPATTHESALAELRRALEDEEGLLLLSGEAGTGKTLLAHLLLDGMEEGTRSAFLTHGSYRKRSELLQAVLFDLGLPYQEMNEQELRLALTDSCLDYFKTDGPTVIVIDEAHLLPLALVEELRLLSNLDGKDGKAVQIVLIGLPSILETIEQPGLKIFRQRLAVCFQLKPMSIEESADYLLHQLRRSGGRPEQLLGEDVLDILSHASRGIPRILNQAAHCAFTLARQSESKTVDAEAAVEAVTRLGLDEGAEELTPIDQQSAAPLSEDAPLPSISVAHRAIGNERPPVYIYGGASESNDHAAEGPLPHTWQVPPQRVG